MASREALSCRDWPTLRPSAVGRLVHRPRRSSGALSLCPTTPWARSQLGGWRHGRDGGRSLVGQEAGLCPSAQRAYSFSTARLAVATVLAQKRARHEELLARLQALQYLQHAWFLLLSECCAAMQLPGANRAAEPHWTSSPPPMMQWSHALGPWARVAVH